MIASFTLPFEVLFVPLYTMMVTLGWFNSYTALIVPFAASAFGIFLARQYILALPTELMEAARIDGASEFGIFYRIVIPNLRPAIAVLGIIFFNASWNDFLWPLIILNDRTKYTVNLALPTLRGPVWRSIWPGVGRRRAGYDSNYLDFCLLPAPLHRRHHGRSAKRLAIIMNFEF